MVLGTHERARRRQENYEDDLDHRINKLREKIATTRDDMLSVSVVSC